MGRFVLMGSVIALVAVLTVLLTGLPTGLVNSGISGLRAMPLAHLAFEPKANSTFSQPALDAGNGRGTGCSVPLARQGSGWRRGSTASWSSPPSRATARPPG